MIVNKSWNLKQLHFEVFKYFKQIFVEWFDWNDPNTTKEPKKGKPDLRTELIKCPYKPAGWPEGKVFTK